MTLRAAAQAGRPRLADAAVIVGQHIEAVRMQKGGEAGVIAAAHGGGRVDDHHWPRRIGLRMAPDKAFQCVGVLGGEGDRQRGRGSLAHGVSNCGSMPAGYRRRHSATNETSAWKACGSGMLGCRGFKGREVGQNGPSRQLLDVSGI